MRAAGISVDKADGDRFDAVVLQPPQLETHVSFIERAHFLAFGIHAPLDRDGILERGERLRLGPDDPRGEPPGHEAARNLHDVAVAFGCDKADLGALALQHRVGGNGGAVQEIVDRDRADPRLRADRGDAIENALGTVVRGGRRLVPPERARIGIEQQKIGERAANVHAKPVTHELLTLPYACFGNDGALATMPGRERCITSPSQ